jgi:hypothetical protein
MLHNYETEYPDDFADALKDWRDRHGWSDAEMARQLRTPYLTLRDWITRRRKCSAEGAIRLLMTLIG